MKNIIKESQLRSMVKVLLEDKTLGPTLAKVNPVVDQSAALTDPQNTDFKPQSKPELMVALSAIIHDLPDQNIPNVYDSLKDALSSKEEEEGKEQMNQSNKKVEETIRHHIRKLLGESEDLLEYFEKDPKTGKLVWKGDGPAPALGKGVKKKDIPAGKTGLSPKEVGPQSPAVKDLRSTLKNLDKREKKILPSDAPAPGRMRKNVTAKDDEAGLKDIASALNVSVAKAHSAVRDSLAKARFIEMMDEDDFQILSLQSVKNYIDLLRSTGELSPADVQLMADHPKMVAELDGFREFFDGVVKSLMKKAIQGMKG
jgi:hypothetical protein